MGTQRQTLPHEIHAKVDFGIPHDAAIAADTKVERRWDARTATHRGTVPGRHGYLIDIAESRYCACADAISSAPLQERASVFFTWIR